MARINVEKAVADLLAKTAEGDADLWLRPENIEVKINGRVIEDIKPLTNYTETKNDGLTD